MRVTGRVLPVLGHDDWQVEPVLVDRGTGTLEWFEVRHRDQVFYFVEIEPEDGCE